jgi:hypothetical protein
MPQIDHKSITRRVDSCEEAMSEECSLGTQRQDNAAHGVLVNTDDSGGICKIVCCVEWSGVTNITQQPVDLSAIAPAKGSYHLDGVPFVVGPAMDYRMAASRKHTK